jgi:hypothetical protein
MLFGVIACLGYVLTACRLQWNRNMHAVCHTILFKNRKKQQQLQKTERKEIQNLGNKYRAA